MTEGIVSQPYPKEK